MQKNQLLSALFTTFSLCALLVVPLSGCGKNKTAVDKKTTAGVTSTTSGSTAPSPEPTTKGKCVVCGKQSDTLIQLETNVGACSDACVRTFIERTHPQKEQSAPAPPGSK